MKYTVLLTQRCNLACSYCYIGQRPGTMSPSTARKIVDFAYGNTPPNELVEIGFFGGEPLLEFPLLTEIVRLFEQHPEYDRDRVLLTVVSNGTIFTAQIARFLIDHDVGFGISCDGPPDVHDRHRVFHNGRGSSTAVARTIRRALETLPGVMVNAVFGPETLETLPDTVAYLSELGVRQIYVNPDYSASWTVDNIAELRSVYDAIADFYCEAIARGDPHFISCIDAKIAVILRGGYHPLERCRMGRGEFAFTPTGTIYPCERLVGDGLNGQAIGHIDTGIRVDALPCEVTPQSVNDECLTCGIRAYCMNWCGCSNYFATGEYDRVSAFLCASEKAETRAALRAFQTSSKEGARFSDHAGGRPLVNSIVIRGVGTHDS